MYLSYAEYQDMGGTLSETEFNRLNYTAQATLDLLTFNRIEQEDGRAKECVFALIGTHSEQPSNVSSVSNDGYSIHYKDADEISQTDKDIVYKFYANTDLMYRGTDEVVGSVTPSPDVGREYLQVRSE